jgi:hypothetical protein
MPKWTIGRWILWLAAMIGFFGLCYDASYLALIAMKGRTDVNVVLSLMLIVLALIASVVVGVKSGIFARWYHGYAEIIRDWFLK